MEESAGLAFDDPTLTLIPLSWGQTAYWHPHTLHVMSLEILHAPGQGILPLTHQGHPWRQWECHCWCPQSPHQLLVWTQWRSMSLSLSWTTCKVEAHIWASPDHVRTVARGVRR